MGGLCAKIDYSPVIVETTNGPVRGKVCWREGNKIVDSYLGIPYALPPIGNLRFKKPVAYGKWPDVRDCVHYGYRCPQTDNLMAQFWNHVVKSEDCLTVNVLAPRWDSKQFPNGFPVVVCIHGGGFCVGTSSLYCGATVARNLCIRDVVYVSLNYRLGAFGFLCTEDDTCNGNLGLWDMTLALEWVKNNIYGFGGDPDNITIMGQSAGGVSVDLLSLSPHSRGLFHKIIAMAGSADNVFALRTKASQAQLCREFARHYGWTGDEKDSKSLYQWYRCQHPTKIETGLFKIKNFDHSQAINIYFVPNMDGDFFPRPISELRKEVPKIPILTGITEWEGLFMSALGQLPGTSEGIEEAMRILCKPYDYGKETDSIRQEILEYYLKDIDIKDKRKVAERAVQCYGDSFINTGVVNYASQMSALGHPVYLYTLEHFNPDGMGMMGHFVPFRGATHCMELRYIIGKGVFWKFKPNEDDLKMIKIMTDYVTNFVRYGDPNGTDGGRSWHAYDYCNPYRYLHIKAETQEMRDGFQGRRAEFWNKNVFSKNRNKALL